ncbi:protein Mis18-alpha-like isoform X2 [Tachypleus tridentatus]
MATNTNEVHIRSRPAAEDLDFSEDSDTSHGVIQCKKCLAIFGDTTCLTGTDEDLLFLALSAVTSYVEEREGLCFSNMGEPDEGCAFKKLFCVRCKTEIGKKYVSSTSVLEKWRDCYCLSAEIITAYQIGKLKPQVCFRDTSNGNPLDIELKLAAIQAVLTDLSNRIAAVEERLNEDD